MTNPLSIGDLVTVALKSTGGTNLTIEHAGLTAEVNGVALVENGTGGYSYEGVFGGQPINESKRVPTAIGRDRKGKLHAIHFWGGRWVGAYHRTLQHCREWETADGDSLPPELAAIADEALTA